MRGWWGSSWLLLGVPGTLGCLLKQSQLGEKPFDLLQASGHGQCADAASLDLDLVIK
jgi:hypothetical protein